MTVPVERDVETGPSKEEYVMLCVHIIVDTAVWIFIAS